MKDVFIADTQKQVELLTDPFVMNVIVALEKEENKSITEMLDEFQEDANYLLECLDELEKMDMITVEVKNDDKFYRKKADFYTISPELISKAPDNVYDHWIFGALHSLQGNYYDILKNIQELGYDNFEDALKDTGYPEFYDSFRFSLQKLYIEADDLKDFHEEVMNVFAKYNKKRSGGINPLLFEVHFSTKPGIVDFMRKLKEGKNSG